MMSDRIRHAMSTIRWHDQAVLAGLCLAEGALLWLAVTALLTAPAKAPDALPLWLAILLIWGTALLPRLLDALDVWDPEYQIVVAAGIVMTLAVCTKVMAFDGFAWRNPFWLHDALTNLIFRPSEARVPVWGIVVTLAYVWWRGKTRAEPGPDAAHRMLRYGTGAALGAAVVLHFTAGGQSSRDAEAAVLLFVAGALAAVGLSRLLSRESPAGMGPAAWLNVAVPIALVFAGGVLAAGLLRRDLLETIYWVVYPALWVLSVIARIVIFAIALVAILILTPILWLLDGRTLRLRPLRIEPGEIGRGGIIERAAESANSTPDPIRYAVALLVLFALFTGLTKFVLRRRPRRRSLRPEEERELTRPIVDLRGLIAALLHALGLRPARVEADSLAALRGDPRWASTVAIRERYRTFLLWSARRGLPRRAGLTPTEHGRALAGLLPGDQAAHDVSALVGLYERARYGGEPAAPAELEQMESAWQRLRHEQRASSGRQ